MAGTKAHQGFGKRPGTVATGVTGPDTTAPIITTAATANCAENATLALALTANESVTWTKTGGADTARFEISGSTLRWTSNGTKNFEIPDDADLNNTYVVQVTATDAALNATNKTITVTVTDVDEVAPTITSSASVSNAENSVLAHSLTANETVTWSLIGGSDLARFELSGSTLRWLSNGTKDFEAPNDSDANNTYVVQVQATDTALNTTNQTITVTVTDVADTDVTAPAITTASTATNPENTVLAVALTANETVTWGLVGGADLARFEISGTTLRWASNGTKNFEAPDDADTNNAYVVTVRATDTASNTTDKTITVTVTDVGEGGGTAGQPIGLLLALTKAA
jgi:ribosomal protein S11